MFPNEDDSSFAPYNREQFTALGRRAVLEIVSGVPLPVSRAARERADELMRSPWFLEVPGVRTLSAMLMAASLGPRVWMRARARHCEVILGAYAYPEGVVSVLLGHLLGLPVVIKCRGPDLHRAERDPLERAQLVHGLRRAEGVVVTCEALVSRVCELGVSSKRVHVIHDGVDRMRFRPRDAEGARRRSGLPVDGTLLLFSGELHEASGLRSFLTAGQLLQAQIPDLTLVVAGDGPLEPRVQEAAEQRGNIIPVGRASPMDLADYIAAADLVCVPGEHEGLPPVVREALASGRPVVARRTGGIPELMTDKTFGSMVDGDDPKELAQAIRAVLSRAVDSLPVARVAHAFLPTWDESAERLCVVLEAAAAAARGQEALRPHGRNRS